MNKTLFVGDWATTTEHINRPSNHPFAAGAVVRIIGKTKNTYDLADNVGHRLIGANLDSVAPLVPGPENYALLSRDALIDTLEIRDAMLNDRDSLIERLQFEVKAAREQEQILREYAGKLERQLDSKS